MRYVWTNAGDDPTWETGDKHNIDGYFFPMFDPITTKTLIQEAKDRGHARGIYMGHGWPQYKGKTPAQIAKIVSDEYDRVFVPGLKVMFNFEEHEPEFIVSVLEEWRKLRPNVNTSWSMEGMQGGWMAANFVARILACKVRLVPQCFGEPGMWRRESDMVLRDLTKRGFPENIVSMFYDAANLGVGWDGFAFTMGRLP